MKNTPFVFFIILLGFGFSSVYGQVFAVSNNRNNVVRVGVNNILTIVAQDAKCEDLIVSTDNGSVAYLEYSHACQFDYSPARLGKAIIHVAVKTKKGVRKIGDSHFWVKAIPLPFASLLGKTGGTISKSLLMCAIAPIAPYNCEEMDAKAIITDFSLYISRHDEIIFSKDYFMPAGGTGVRFDDLAIRYFSTLTAGDVVWLTQIKARGPDSRSNTLADIKLTIVE